MSKETEIPGVAVDAPYSGDGYVEEPLVEGNLSFHDITRIVAGHAEKKPPLMWWPVFLIALSTLGIFGLMIAHLFWNGTGVWGNNNPVGWGFPIVNFVFWVGIGHAGTLISAILFLFRQRWRTAINRSAEAMTLFAVVCALSFPTIHVGRIWFIYWTLPIPNQMLMWPQFKSPLLWDVFAVSIYGTVSLLFWYVGLIPDWATMRDRAQTRLRQKVFGFLAMGWTGANRHWRHYERAYLLLAGLATPLVLSVHSVVSFDFAVSIVPGWHTTIFPPYFVAGAIFSGFAMVMTLMIIARSVYKLQSRMTPPSAQTTRAASRGRLEADRRARNVSSDGLRLSIPLPGIQRPSGGDEFGRGRASLPSLGSNPRTRKEATPCRKSRPQKRPIAAGS